MSFVVLSIPSKVLLMSNRHAILVMLRMRKRGCWTAAQGTPLFFFGVVFGKALFPRVFIGSGENNCLKPSAPRVCVQEGCLNGKVMYSLSGIEAAHF